MNRLIRLRIYAWLGDTPYASMFIRENVHYINDISISFPAIAGNQMGVLV